MVKPQAGLMQAHTLYSRDAPRGPKSDRGTSNPRPHFLHCGRSMPCASCEKDSYCLLVFLVCQGSGGEKKGELWRGGWAATLPGGENPSQPDHPPPPAPRPFPCQAG